MSLQTSPYYSILARTSHNLKITSKRVRKTHRNSCWESSWCYQENLDDFLNRTTIPGVSQWINHKSLTWKIIWMTVIFIGLVTAICQSTFALSGYSQDAVVQSVSFKSKHELIFPALTFCTNILVDINQDKKNIDPAIEDLIERAEQEVLSNKSLSYNEIKTISEKYRLEIMTTMLDWGDANRITTAFGNSKFIKHCNWKKKDCNVGDKNVFLQSENLRYGKCITFNPGLKRSHIQKAKAGNGFILILDMNPISRLKLINKNYAIVLVHPTEQPPIPKPETLNYLFPGNVLRLFLTGKQINRLNVRKIKQCIDPHDQNFENPDEFYKSQDMPYKYSKDACTKSCHLYDKMYRKNYPCFEADIPLISLLKKKRELKSVSFCNLTSDVLTGKITRINQCNCPELCKEPMLVLNPVTFSLLKTRNSDLNKPLPISAEYYNDASQNITVIQIVYASTEYMRITENPKYSQTDFFGLIGGNLSLWVGVNVFCIIELVELVYIFVQNRFKKPPRRRRFSKCKYVQTY